MKRILFYDPVSPIKYSFGDQNRIAMGGSEATLLRVSESLAKTNEVVISLPKHDLVSSIVKPNFTIVQRSIDVLPSIRAKYPDTKLFAWMHDIIIPSEASKWPTIAQTGATVICVSDWHRLQAIEAFKAAGWQGEFPVIRIYNPIDDDLGPKEAQTYDKNRLCYFSSPHKGLRQVFTVFERLLSFNPKFTLYTSNPGYIPTATPPDSIREHVRVCGSLPHPHVMEVVRGSLCCLHLNSVFPETFGLVNAEADAVGTPVLTHRLGAASETLYHPAELIDSTNIEKVINRIMSWYSGERPVVKANPKFRLKQVTVDWERVLK